MMGRLIVGGLLFLLMPLSVNAQRIPRSQARSMLDGETWATTGGYDPVGSYSPIVYSKFGQLLDSNGNVRDRRRTQFATFSINCRNDPPALLILSVGSTFRSGDGQSLIQSTSVAEPYQFEWKTPVFSSDVSGKSIAEADFSELREEFKAGDTFTVSASTTEGTIYWRFNLSGFEVQESLCP